MERGENQKRRLAGVRLSGYGFVNIFFDLSLREPVNLL